jgi:MFS family permease
MAGSPRGFGPANVDARRLVDGETTVKERLLLLAGIEDAPSNDAGRRRTLVALGLAVATSTVATSASAAATASKAAALAPVKWLIFGTVGAALAVGTTALMTRTEPPSPQGSSVAHVGHKATSASTTVSATPMATALAAPVASLAAQHPDARAPLTGRASPAVSPPRVDVSPGLAREEVASPPELAAQVAALDRARAALRAGRADESLSLLDGFDRRYPRSTLGPEVTVVRVRALLSRGERARASQLVRAYCRNGGRGAYGQRLMALVGLSDTSCEASAPRP